MKLSLSHWYPGSGVVLDCIDSLSLLSFLLTLFIIINNECVSKYGYAAVTIFKRDTEYIYIYIFHLQLCDAAK